MIGTVNDLKGKLGIVASDTSRDGALELVLQDASAKIASLTRFSEAAETGRQDLFEEVQLGTILTLTKRPVTNVVVEGRWYMGDASWSAMSADVVDANEGRVTPLGRDAWWPPLMVVRPPYMRWRNVIWPIVRVTYDVTGQGSDANAPQALQDATLALAAYWFDRHLAGAAADAQIGQLSKEYMTEAVPSWVYSAISEHRTDRASFV